MIDTSDADGRNSKSFEAAEEHATQGVTDGLAEAGFQGLEFESALKIIRLLHRDFVWRLEVQNTAHIVNDTLRVGYLVREHPT